MTSLPPDLVIFDCDGVLIDSEVMACTVEAEILSELGHAITPETFRDRFVGTSRSHSLAALEADWGRPLPDGYATKVRERLEAEFHLKLRAVDGMMALVAALQGRCAVASSSSLARLALTLGLTGFAPMLEGRIFSAEQVTRGKPAPDLFLFTAASLGVAPDRCLVVEDSRFGIEAAKAAGMSALGFTGASHCGPDYARQLSAAGADAICASAAELARYLGIGP